MNVSITHRKTSRHLILNVRHCSEIDFIHSTTAGADFIPGSGTVHLKLRRSRKRSLLSMTYVSRKPWTAGS